MSLLSGEWLDFSRYDQKIEGVGNEAIVLFSILVGLAIPAIFVILKSRVWIVPEHAIGLREGVLSQEEIDEKTTTARNRDDQQCAICLNRVWLSCVTNCGHVFCFSCIYQYWRIRGTPITPIDCPACRTPVAYLLPYDWPNAADSSNPEQLQQSTNELYDYNRRFSANRTILDYFEDLPEMLPFVFRSLLGYNFLLILFRVRVVLIFAAVFAYLLIPLEIFPESAYGLIGFADDIFVVTLMFIYLAIAFRHFLTRRAEPHDN